MCIVQQGFGKSVWVRATGYKEPDSPVVTTAFCVYVSTTCVRMCLHALSWATCPFACCEFSGHALFTHGLNQHYTDVVICSWRCDSGIHVYTCSSSGAMWRQFQGSRACVKRGLQWQRTPVTDLHFEMTVIKLCILSFLSYHSIPYVCKFSLSKAFVVVFTSDSHCNEHQKNVPLYVTHFCLRGKWCHLCTIDLHMKRTAWLTLPSVC